MTSITVTGVNRAVVSEVPGTPALVEVAVSGPQGAIGPAGPRGEAGIVDDPGDLTLIFDNKLI